MYGGVRLSEVSTRGAGGGDGRSGGDGKARDCSTTLQVSLSSPRRSSPRITTEVVADLSDRRPSPCGAELRLSELTARSHGTRNELDSLSGDC